MFNPLTRLDCKIEEIVKLKNGDRLLVYRLPNDEFIDCTALGCDDLAEFAAILVEASDSSVCYNCHAHLEHLKLFKDSPVRVTTLSRDAN